MAWVGPLFDGHVCSLGYEVLDASAKVAGEVKTYNAAARAATSERRRHPRCRCHHEPVTEDAPESLTPPEIFDSMSRTEQDRIFTPDSAQAIRDGADMNQIVNARRGMSTVSVGGRDVKVTSEGATRRGYFSQQRRLQDAERYAQTPETTTGAGPRGARANYRERRIAKPRLLPEEIYKQAGTNRDEAIRLLHANGYYVAT